MYDRNFSPIIQNNKYINNNKLIFNHFYNYNNNPQYFQPHFHPNISFKYMSNLVIQYPVQIFVKQTKKIKIVKHKLVTYFPQKVQIEIRPCFIYQENQNFQMPYPRYQFPMFQMYSNRYIDQPQFQNQLYTNQYMNNRNNYNEYMNQRKIIRNKVKRKRPVFKIPPCKKAVIKRGKSLSFIFKYYDENYILEDDNEEEKVIRDKITESEKKERKENICRTENNYFSDNEGKRFKKRLDFTPENNKINIHINNMKSERKGKEFEVGMKLMKEIDININVNNNKNIDQNFSENINPNNNKKNEININENINVNINVNNSNENN